jgi:hypothetical protein
MTADMAEVARLRAVLIRGHDALVVALESLERVITTVEDTWPALGWNGRIGPPAGAEDGEGTEPQLYDDLSGGTFVPLAALGPGSEP